MGKAHFLLLNTYVLGLIQQICPMVERSHIMDGGYSFRAIFIPSEYHGDVYRIGETILTNQHVLKISAIYSVRVESEFKHFVAGTVHSKVPSTGTQHLVIKVDTVTVVATHDIIRKVMLYQHPMSIASGSQHYEVIDFKKQQLPVSAESVVIPCYVEKGDMVWVSGDSNEQWLGYVDSSDESSKTVQIYFFTESQSQPGSFVRETRGLSARNTVHWNSVISIAEGHWEVRGDKWIVK